MKINPFRLERYFARYEFRTEFLFCSSDCESLAVKDLLALEDGAEEAFLEHWLLDKYGAEYADYLKTIPRFLLLK